MPEVTYFGTHRLAYANALVKLVEFARGWSGPVFEISPLALDAMENQGLTVTGDDLKAVMDLLDRTPGLVKVPF